MNRVESAILETLDCYPDLSEQNLVELFIDYVEKNLPEITRGIRLPSLSFLSRKAELRLARTRLRLRGKTELRERTKMRLIASLRRIQESLDESYDGRTASDVHRELHNGWTASDTHSLDGFGKIANSFAAVEIHHISGSGELHRIPQIEDLDSSIAELSMGRGIDAEELFPFEEEPGIPEKFEIDPDLLDIYDKASGLSSGKVRTIGRITDSVYGEIVQVEVELNAKEALDLWLNLLDEVEHGDILTVKWTGKMDVTEDELVKYIVEIMMSSGVGPRALPGFDVVEAVREGRE